MSRLNGVPRATQRAMWSRNVPWFLRPVSESVCARISAAWCAPAFWSAIETCPANSWMSSNSVSSNRAPGPRRASARVPVDTLRAAERGDHERIVVPRARRSADARVVAGVGLEAQRGRRARTHPVADGPRVRVRLGRHHIRVVAPREQGPERPGRRLADGQREHVHLHEAADALGDLLHHRPRIERGQDRLRRAHQLPLRGELARQQLGLGPQQLGGVGIGHRLGGHRGVDLEVAQVVPGELVETQLGQHDDADGRGPRSASAPGASTRRGPPRCPGWSRRAGRARHPAGTPRCRARATQPVMPWPTLTRSCSPNSPTYSPISPRHATGMTSCALHPVHAHVVVVDELPQLGADGLRRSRSRWSAGRGASPASGWTRSCSPHTASRSSRARWAAPASPAAALGVRRDRPELR